MEPNEYEVTISLQVLIEPDRGKFHAWCPVLKGLHVDGETEGEALRNASSAIFAYWQSLTKDYGGAGKTWWMKVL